MKKIVKTIKVDQKHFIAGEPHDCQYCAVALAIKDHFPKHKVRVSEKYTNWADNFTVYGINLYPATEFEKQLKTTFHNDYEKVNNFINDFDDGFFSDEFPFKPFEFELTAYEL